MDPGETELKEDLDMSSEGFVYQDLRAKANTWMERKRDQMPRNFQQMEQRNTTGVTPTDVSYAQGSHDEWNSQWPCDDWTCWPQAEMHEVQEWGPSGSQLSNPTNHCGYVPAGGRA